MSPAAPHPALRRGPVANRRASGRRRRSPVAAIAALLVAAALVAAACSTDIEVAVDESALPAEAPGDDDPGSPGSGSPDTGEEGGGEAEPTPAPTPEPTPNPPGRAELPDDLLLEQGPRIAVQGTDGRIITMLGDGTNQVPLTDTAEGTVSRFPTWSPDANRLAWVSARPNGSDPRIRSARFDGSAWTDVESPTSPFLLMWDPSASRIASLGPGDTGFDLGIVDLGVQEPTWERLDGGSPFWLSWGPEGDALLIHASGLRLDLVPLDGPSQVLEPLPGSFQTPAWLPGPVPLVYADTIDDVDFLVVAGDFGAGRREIITYDGYLQFTVSAESGLIALQVLDESLAPVPETITASYDADGTDTGEPATDTEPGTDADEGSPIDPTGGAPRADSLGTANPADTDVVPVQQADDFTDVVDPIPRDQLTVMATFGGDPIVLHPDPFDRFPGTNGPVKAFHWSPDGSQLAWLIEVEAGAGCSSETAVWEWRFWTGTAIVTGPRFVPTPTFACFYVPFFDQFDQSVSFWSPDGTELVYAGTDITTGERGVFSHQIGSVVPPRLLIEGEIGVWSPTAAGSAAASAL